MHVSADTRIVLNWSGVGWFGLVLILSYLISSSHIIFKNIAHVGSFSHIVFVFVFVFVFVNVMP